MWPKKRFHFVNVKPKAIKQTSRRFSSKKSVRGSRVKLALDAQHFPDRLRWIVWKRLTGSLWGHPWEVSLGGLWRFLRERGTIGGTSCCGSRCDTVEELFTGSRPPRSGRTPAYVSSPTVYHSRAADLCVSTGSQGKGQPSSQGLQLCKASMTLWIQWSLSAASVWWIGEKYTSCKSLHLQHFRLEAQSALSWFELWSHFCSFVSHSIRNRTPSFYTLKSI